MTTPVPDTMLRRRWWSRTLLWAGLVVVSIVLTGLALERTFFLIVGPGPEQLRLGRVLMLGGIFTSVGAAMWSYFRHHRWWITACVAAPSVVVGGASLMFPDSLLPPLVGALALPAAFVGLLGGVLGRNSASPG